MKRNHESGILLDNVSVFLAVSICIFLLSPEKYEISHIIVPTNVLLFNVVNGGTVNL